MDATEVLQTLRRNVNTRFPSWSDSKAALELLEAVGDVLWKPDDTAEGHIQAIAFLSKIEDDEVCEALHQLRYDASLREKREPTPKV